MGKKESRLRRAKRCRKQIQRLGNTRISVHRSLKHIYAQVIEINGNVIASASTLDKALESSRGTNNIETAKLVGKLLAERAIKAGVTNVAFDRSGFKYHGRVKALADAAREGGLNF